MIAALVPVKALDQAKGRLAALLSQEERRVLALAMLEDVLRALQAVPRVEHVAGVSPDTDVLARAEKLGAEPLSAFGVVEHVPTDLAERLVEVLDRVGHGLLGEESARREHRQ